MKTKSTLPRLVLNVCLGLSLATLATAAERFRLDRIGVVQFTAVGSDRLQRSEGVLQLDNRLSWGPVFEQPRPANTPAWVIGRVLVRREDWLAYRALGIEATANFRIGEGQVAIQVGDATYWVAEVNPEARFADGRLGNISTRARIAGAGESVTAGFVVQDRARWVLIRGVGSGLAPFGVVNALPNPAISVRKGSTVFYFNDDWGTRPDAADIRATAARLGAFALPEAGRDAALLIELTPGAYTVSVESSVAGETGEVLVEVYSAPEPELP
jgi:hypothetical protein